MKKIMINKNSQKGGMLLEMILMVAVLALILPFLQGQQKKQIDLSQNVMISKDMMKIKSAVSSFLDDNLVSLSLGTGTCFVNLTSTGAGPAQDPFYDTGSNTTTIPQCTFVVDASQGFAGKMDKYGLDPFAKGFENFLGKQYYLLFRILPPDSNQVTGSSNVEVLIVSAKAGSQESTKINTLKILKELGSDSGYLSSTAGIGTIEGFNWEDKCVDWSMTLGTSTDTTSLFHKNDIVLKISKSTNAGRYISKELTEQTDNDENNKMATNILMSNNDIIGPTNFTVKYLNAKNLTANADGGILTQDTFVAGDGTITSLDTNVVMFLNKYGPDSNLITGYPADLDLRPSNDISYNKDIYFYGTLSDATGVATAEEIQTGILIAKNLIPASNTILYAKNRIRANSLTVSQAVGTSFPFDTVYMTFGYLTGFTNVGKIKTIGNSAYYISIDTIDANLTHNLNNLIIDDVNSFFSDKNIAGIVSSSRSHVSDIISSMKALETNINSDINSTRLSN